MSEATVLWLRPSREDGRVATPTLRSVPPQSEWTCENCDTPNVRRKRCRDCGTSRY